MMMYGPSPGADKGILPAEELGLELVEDSRTGCGLEECGGDGMVLISNVQAHILTLVISAMLCCAIHSFKHDIAVYLMPEISVSHRTSSSGLSCPCPFPCPHA